MAGRDRRPLLNYLKVQEFWEQELVKSLSRAAAASEAEIRRLSGRTNISSRIAADQARQAQKALLAEQVKLWRSIGLTVEAGRVDAAAQAVATNFHYEEMLLRAGLSKAEREIMLNSLKAQASRGIDALVAKQTGLSDYTLSSTVYRAQQLSSGAIDRIIKNNLAHGKSWRDLAKDVRDSIRPDVPGGVSYAAKRLGRTELNNAFHAVAVKEGAESPFIMGQKWNLSGSHPKPDECNQYAESEHYDGGEPGVYRAADVPSKPHPQCLCFLTPETPDRDEFIRQFQAGKYDTYLAKQGVEIDETKLAAAPSTRVRSTASAPRKVVPRKLDPKAYQDAKTLKTVNDLFGDADELDGMSRSVFTKILSGAPPKSVTQYKNAYVTVIDDSVVEQAVLNDVARIIGDLEELDGKGEVTVIVRKLTREENPNGGTMAYTSGGADSMVVSPEGLSANGSVSGLMPSATGERRRYVLTHEYGHMRGPEKSAMPNIDSSELSRYGRSDKMEAYAEAYAEWIVTKGATTNKTVKSMAKEFKWPKPSS